jgi:hypothetical protein
MDEEPKPKWAAIELGYRNYVLPLADAVKVLELVAAADTFEDRYHSDTKTTTKHIYPQEDTRLYIRILTDDMYRMAKLAGKPE